MNEQLVNGLKEVRKSILIESYWTKGSSAKNEDGNVTSIENADAVSYCLTGALRKVLATNKPLYKNALAICIKLLWKRNWKEYIHLYNDDLSRTHKDILDLLDEMILEASKCAPNSHVAFIVDYLNDRGYS